MNEMRNSTELLLAHGISPTYQRLQVLRYLRHHGKHPRAEDIHAFMQRRRLALSRATVYNVLNLFVQTGLAREIRTPQGLRYDVDTRPHGHFLCRGCGHVADVPAACCPLHLGEALAGFQVHLQELLYQGLCPACQ